LIVCADERYELPIDLVLLGWAATVLPDAVRSMMPATGGAAGKASSPRR
jgi:hypothetical protein